MKAGIISFLFIPCGMSILGTFALQAVDNNLRIEGGVSIKFNVESGSLDKGNSAGANNDSNDISNNNSNDDTNTHSNDDTNTHSNDDANAHSNDDANAHSNAHSNSGINAKAIVANFNKNLSINKNQK